MRWLKSAADVVSLDEITRSGDALKRHQVAITFDDGYLNNVDTVMPIMQRLGLPMTWFVSTAFVDDPARLPWWDMIDLLLETCQAGVEFSEPEIRGSYDLALPPHRAWVNKTLRAIIKAAPPARRDALVRELAGQLQRYTDIPENAFARPREVAAIDADRVELGGHTLSHPNLAACAESDRRHELEAGKARLEQLSGRSLNWFAYPFGGRDTFDSATAEAVNAAGFGGAVTLLPGTVTARSNLYMLPRIAVSAALSLADFKARVAGAPLFAWAERQRARFMPAGA